MLIVDDNATNRTILRHYLRSWGMIPVESESGPQALKILLEARDAGRPIPAAILDFQMPGMDGMQLAAQIKQDATLAPTKLLMLTSLARRGDAKQARELGVAKYQTKPVRQSELYNNLVNMIEGDEPRPKGLMRRKHRWRERAAGRVQQESSADSSRRG